MRNDVLDFDSPFYNISVSQGSLHVEERSQEHRAVTCVLMLMQAENTCVFRGPGTHEKGARSHVFVSFPEA